MQAYFKKQGWKSARIVLVSSPQYQKWEKEARESLTTLKTPHELPITTSVAIAVDAYYKGQRPDLTGVLESIGDCLEGIIWKNDRQIDRILSATITHDKENPRTEVLVVFNDVKSPLGESRG